MSRLRRMFFFYIDFSFLIQKAGFIGSSSTSNYGFSSEYFFRFTVIQEKESKFCQIIQQTCGILNINNPDRTFSDMYTTLNWVI